MKVAVVTNYDKKNYGSVLQAYALQKKLSELGTAKCIVLENQEKKNKTITLRLKRFICKSGNNYSLKSKIEIKIAKRYFKNKYRKIKTFCQNNINSYSCYSYKEAEDIAKEYDLIIAGSDQIWSPKAGTLSDFTLLKFADGITTKKYSYAASLGVREIDSETEKLFKKNINNFEAISVREKTGKLILENCCDKEIRVDVDPTMLYDNSFWKNIVIETKEDHKPYIFVYMLRPEPLTVEVAKALSQKTGYKVKICSNRIVEKNLFENITDAGIEDFLSLIYNAEYVITNSFHGTVFSLQFHKKFLSIAIEGTGSRVIDLLGQVNLSNHIVKSVNNIEMIDKSTDWDYVDNILKQNRSYSIEYLKHIIERKNNDKVELYKIKNDCCGCGACMNVCPQNAINMEKDLYGFIYPKIDEKKCIKCRIM